MALLQLCATVGSHSKQGSKAAAASEDSTFYLLQSHRVPLDESVCLAPGKLLVFVAPVGGGTYSLVSVLRCTHGKRSHLRQYCYLGLMNALLNAAFRGTTPVY